MHSLLSAPLFGPKHLVGLGYVIVIVLIGLFAFGSKADKRKILILTLLFYLFEIIKIGYYLVESGTYPMNHLPLHLCSLPLYVYPILYFSKKGSKLEEMAMASAFITIIAGGIVALLIPTNIIGGNEQWLPFTGNFLPFISFTYHGLMIMAPIYLISSKTYVPKFKDALYAMMFTLGLMILALIFNAILDKDYMLLNYGNGSPFQFLLDYGQLVYTTTMIMLGLVVISLVSLITTSIYKVVQGSFK